MTLAVAQAMAATAAAALAGNDAVGSVSVTLDPREIPSKVAGDDVVVCVNPPQITYDTWHQQTLTWAVWVVAGPSNDPHRAWERLSTALDLLHRPLEADGARPDAMVHNRVAYPAYVITITDHESE